MRCKTCDNDVDFFTTAHQGYVFKIKVICKQCGVNYIDSSHSCAFI